MAVRVPRCIEIFTPRRLSRMMAFWMEYRSADGWACSSLPTAHGMQPDFWRSEKQLWPPVGSTGFRLCQSSTDTTRTDADEAVTCLVYVLRIAIEWEATSESVMTALICRPRSETFHSPRVIPARHGLRHSGHEHLRDEDDNNNTTMKGCAPSRGVRADKSDLRIVMSIRPGENANVLYGVVGALNRRKPHGRSAMTLGGSWEEHLSAGGNPHPQQ